MRSIPTNQILQGNVLDVLRTLPDDSIDMCISSPPYWGVRAYGTRPQTWGGDPGCDHAWGKPDLNFARLMPDDNQEFLPRKCSKCQAWRGELGHEPLYLDFVSHLCDIFDEVRRVLRPTGTCWVNLGDTYLEKCLAQIPSRFGIEMTNRGWTLRNELVWFKPNVTPSSAKDRFLPDFEKIFFFSKQKHYFFAQQFEPSTNPGRLRRPKAGLSGDKFKYGAAKGMAVINPETAEASMLRVLLNGRNKRCVWRVPTGSYNGAHFAVYPPALIETPIKAGCPEMVCNKCGKPRNRVVEQRELRPEEWTEELREKLRRAGADLHGGYSGRNRKNYPANVGGASDRKRRTLKAMRSVMETKGYTDCGCNAGFSPGIVLDPFMGSGTTAIVALRQKRRFLGIELNPDYIEMAIERIRDDARPGFGQKGV
jgi:site-specific DNA-methyltransferase (adenine-specific)